MYMSCDLEQDEIHFVLISQRYKEKEMIKKNTATIKYPTSDESAYIFTSRIDRTSFTNTYSDLRYPNADRVTIGRVFAHPNEKTMSHWKFTKFIWIDDWQDEYAPYNNFFSISIFFAFQSTKEFIYCRVPKDGSCISEIISRWNDWKE